MERQEYLKHKETIDAWANGAEIEASHDGEEWFPCNDEPSWFVSVNFRVKPAPTFELGDKVLFVKEWSDNHAVSFSPEFKKVLNCVGTVIIRGIEFCQVAFENFTWCNNSRNHFAIPNECLQLVEYVPFDFEDDLLGNRIIDKETRKHKSIITSQVERGIGTDDEAILYKDLLEDFTFLDGNPCGKLKQ